MVSECQNCAFYVKPEENFCPDCGASDPSQPLTFDSNTYDRPLSVKTIAFCAVMILTVLTLLYLFKDNDNFSEAPKWIALGLIPVAVFILFVGPAILHFLGRKERRNRQTQSQTPTNFRFIEDEISMRIHELAERLHELRKSARRGVRQSNSAARTKAAQAITEIQDLRTRYDLLSDKIDFARLQNNLLSIIERQKDLKIEAEVLEKVDDILSEIEDIKASLTDERATAISGNERELLQQITETEKICEAFLKRKSDVELYRNDFETSSIKDLAWQTTNLDVWVTLKNVIASFNESERAYQRLLKIQRQ